MQSSQPEPEGTHTVAASETERGETSLHASENKIMILVDTAPAALQLSLSGQQTAAVGDLEIGDFEGMMVIITPPMHPLVRTVNLVCVPRS